MDHYITPFICHLTWWGLYRVGELIRNDTEIYDGDTNNLL